MWSLGLETSTRRGSVAIWNGQGVPLERSLGAQSQKHATTIFQVLDELLKEQNLKPADIGRVAVSIGPGSFTGLRIGVVAAKTLAYSLGCEVKAIDTFWPLHTNLRPRLMQSRSSAMLKEAIFSWVISNEMMQQNGRQSVKSASNRHNRSRILSQATNLSADLD
jgi:tRNA threonylcarbamoyl adenosine modification protein YeaZ